MFVDFSRLSSEDGDIEDKLSNKESRLLLIELSLILVELLVELLLILVRLLLVNNRLGVFLVEKELKSKFLRD